MPKFPLLLLAALGLCLTTSAVEAAKPSAVQQPFLYQINGGEAPSYLFGTIHAGVATEELPDIVTKSIGNSSVFVMEAAPQHLLAESLSDTKYFPLGLPMDVGLARSAHKQGLRVLTLESVAFQRMLLQKIVGGPEELTTLLSSELGELDELVAGYRSGNLETIAGLTAMDNPEAQELLLNRRNRTWTSRLRPGLAKGGIFAAVGVGHLSGPEGLLELLHTQGYTTRRLS